MAAKPQRGNESKERKRILGGERKSGPKKLKLQSSNLSPRGATKPFKSSKQPLREQRQQYEANPKIQKGDTETKKQSRSRAKELAEARKKRRKKYYTLEQELARLWEKMRRRNIGKEERSKFVTEALNKMKGKIPEIASSHVSSRVLQPLQLTSFLQLKLR